MKKLYKNTITGCIGLSLFILPGCWESTENKEEKTMDMSVKKSVATKKSISLDMPELKGDVIVSMDGKAVVTTDSLQDEKNKLIEANPQFKMMLAMMNPKQFDRNLSEGLTNQAIVDKYVHQNGIDSNPQYQKELAEGYKAVERMLNTKFFSQGYVVTVSDADVKSFYDKNKSVMPDLVVSQGGTRAFGVKFENKEAAQVFEKKLSANSDIEALAKAEGVLDNLEDFNFVNAQSIGISDKLKNGIMSIDTAPSIKLFEEDVHAFWVLQATEKKEPEYIPFAQIKSQIKEYLEKEKRTEMFDQEIEQLKKEYKVIVNEDYFMSDETESNMSAENLMQSMISEDDMHEHGFVDDLDSSIA